MRARVLKCFGSFIGGQEDARVETDAEEDRQSAFRGGESDSAFGQTQSLLSLRLKNIICNIFVFIFNKYICTVPPFAVHFRF